jgi:hypothetical protein
VLGRNDLRRTYLPEPAHVAFDKSWHSLVYSIQEAVSSLYMIKIFELVTRTQSLPSHPDASG